MARSAHGPIPAPRFLADSTMSGPDDPHGVLRIGGVIPVQCPGHSRPQVVDLGGDAGLPDELFRSIECWCCSFDELGVVLRMAPAEPVSGAFHIQVLQCVLPQRLEE